MARQRRGRGNPTIADVAELARVSAITVSRTLRTPKQVSDATRARVMEAVEALEYRPDPVAVALASAQSTLIGVMIPSVTNTVFADVLRGIHKVADPTEFNIQFANTRYSATEEIRLLRQFISQRPAGLIVTGLNQSDEFQDLLARARCPVVQIMEIGDKPVDMMVGFSHGDAASAAASHLLEQGYRRIGFLGARVDARSQQRMAGFRATLEAAGHLDPALLIEAHSRATVALGGTLLSSALDLAPDLDAVMCNNDVLALGVLFEAQRRGIEVPSALGICGFNDNETMAYTVPTITSVRTPRLETGARAMEMVLARIREEDLTETVLDLGFELVIRDSTRRQA